MTNALIVAAPSPGQERDPEAEGYSGGGIELRLGRREIVAADAFFELMRAAVIPGRSYFQGTPARFNAPTGSIFGRKNPETLRKFPTPSGSLLRATTRYHPTRP